MTPPCVCRLLCCARPTQAEKLVGKLDALGSTAGDLGLSLFKVAKFEVRPLTLSTSARGCAVAGWPSGANAMPAASPPRPVPCWLLCVGAAGG
jgi:hypothetical protein